MSSLLFVFHLTQQTVNFRRAVTACVSVTLGSAMSSTEPQASSLLQQNGAPVLAWIVMSGIAHPHV